MSLTKSDGLKVIEWLRAQPDARESAHGVIRDAFRPSERYVIDFGGPLQAGWEQWDTDQDAWYFGVWVCVSTREVLTYAEGDWSLMTCPTAEAFRAELARMAEFYGPTPAHIVVIDQDGNATGYVSERAS